MKLNIKKENTNLFKDEEIRIKKFFAWFPVKIIDEIRWLEKIIIKEKYNSFLEKWIPIEFI